MQALQVWLTKKEQPRPDQQPAQLIKRRVVSLNPPKEPLRPKKANYLAEHDRTAKKEKKARLQSQDDAVNLDGNGEIFLNKYKTKQDPLGILPHFDRQGRLNTNSSPDYLPHVEEGEGTELNAWQWRHAPFFNRIKSRIGKIWSPQAQINRYDPQGVLLGQQNRVTVMLVTIDREGSLVDLAITEPSGVAYLDEEAERAFKEAAPFLYPPQELFLDKELFSFTFAFYLQINRGFSFDFNWDQDG